MCEVTTIHKFGELRNSQVPLPTILSASSTLPQDLSEQPMHLSQSINHSKPTMARFFSLLSLLSLSTFCIVVAGSLMVSSDGFVSSGRVHLVSVWTHPNCIGSCDAVISNMNATNEDLTLPLLLPRHLFPLESFSQEVSYHTATVRCYKQSHCSAGKA